MEGRIKERRRLIDVRNWEDLNADCLINIFGRVGLESLMFDIPFVCKSWYKASLDPHCWKILDFQFMSLSRSSWAFTVWRKDRWERYKNLPDVTPSTQFIKIAVNRSCGLATEVIFYKCLLRKRILEYILERCPALKTLTLPKSNGNMYMWWEEEDYDQTENGQCLLKMISKLPNLESIFNLNTDGNLKEILNQIHLHCPNFVSLRLRNFFCNDIASDAIVTFLPNIKHLVLKGSILTRKNLLRIISGCPKLELLDGRICIGFDSNDAEILKMASHIKIFKLVHGQLQI